mgnify:CR=1 FL=1
MQRIADVPELSDLAARWSAALLRDLEYWAALTKGSKLTSLYFGGGTPSLAPLSVIEGVIDACARLWGFESAPEITIEANPTDAEQSRFEDFARAGVNRLSLGVQSFDDAALKFLGRDHDGRSARRAVELALALSPRATFDLIYALPGQAASDWRRALREALTALIYLESRKWAPIVAKTGAMADALSTGVFVMGPDAGMALVEHLPDVDALIVTDRNQVLISSGLKDRVTILAQPTDAP